MATKLSPAMLEWLYEQRPVTSGEIKNDPYVAAEFLDLLRWLASEEGYPDMPLTPEKVWKLFIQGYRVGTVWSEACEDLGFPVRPDYI